jgi:hypothetical protein
VCGALALAVPASGETYINETSTSFLMTLDAANSPYVLSADFSVMPGGTLYIGPGAQLHIENGAVLRGVGGDIAIQGSAASQATVMARPGAAAPAWGGITLGTGSDLSVTHGLLEGGTPTVTAGEGSSVTMQLSTVRACGAWCLAVTGRANISLSNTSFADAQRGILDGGSQRAGGADLTFTNFSVAAVSFEAPATMPAFGRVRVRDSPVGLVLDGVALGEFARWDVRVTAGAAAMGNSSSDVHIHNSTLVSETGVALDMPGTARLRLADNTVEGALGALRLHLAFFPLLSNNRLASPGGPCLELPGATRALLEGNTLDGCARALSIPRGTAPPNATAGPSNTVDGKPFLWLDGGSNVTVDGSLGTAYGLVVLVSVTQASVRDLALSGAGIFLFGCADVTIERVHITSAESAVTAVGSRAVHIVALRASDVGSAFEAWSDAAFPAPTADVRVERARVERTTGPAFSFAGASNVTLAWAMVVDAAVAVRVDASNGVLVSNVLTVGGGSAVWATNTTGLTVVDSAFEGVSGTALVADNTTGIAARNAFIDNGDHASAPGSPSFAFNELLAGNYWTNWSAPDANGDGWADIPYNLTDGTARDMRPRVVRWDFHPTALPSAPPRVELGQQTQLVGNSSFDDFLVSEFYWQVTAPGDNAAGSGLTFLWKPNATGVHMVTLSVVGSFGASDEYAFPVLVVDTVAPDFSFLALPRAEAGTNLTVALDGTDNDPAFPVGARVEWGLAGEAGPIRSGNATGLTFAVAIGHIGNHTLNVTLFDAAGNAAVREVAFTVFDTVAPDIVVAFEGEPDLGLPFLLDGAASFDPSGLDAQSARWTWVEAGTTRELTTFPVAEVTFEHAGNYTVTLRLCDALGNCGQAAVALTARDTHGPRLVRIHVAAPLRDALEVTPTSSPVVEARVGEEVVFEAFATDPSGNVTFLWDFGDGTTAEGARVVHAFERSGELTVTLTMTDPLGNTNPAAFRARLAPGAGFFGEIIPGVSGDLVVLVAAIVAASVAALLFVRRRRPPREGDELAP